MNKLNIDADDTESQWKPVGEIAVSIMKKLRQTDDRVDEDAYRIEWIKSLKPEKKSRKAVKQNFYVDDDRMEIARIMRDGRWRTAGDILAAMGRMPIPKGKGRKAMDQFKAQVKDAEDQISKHCRAMRGMGLLESEQNAKLHMMRMWRKT